MFSWHVNGCAEPFGSSYLNYFNVDQFLVLALSSELVKLARYLTLQSLNTHYLSLDHSLPG